MTKQEVLQLLADLWSEIGSMRDNEEPMSADEATAFQANLLKVQEFINQ